ncbi:acVLRF1 family peptidyl-tRNA hydrolase [Nocardioides jensenii]|uniref:acVLRF1 family peptidyl-tRNA hydrolase n=1 Tax=Nocardioides jensenii TaxID=1843 RepID=UPI000832BC46|nr:acVLRF1 family peptidyl-tRNA hydrolase [Nocardioides jensenii]
MTSLLVPTTRLVRWVENFAARHGGSSLDVTDGALSGLGGDGSTFVGRPPFGRSYDGAPAVASFVEACVPPRHWGVLLVRKGGFAIASLNGDTIVESKVGQRHVQGRTKAGGQSQQRFARRRDNQARQAYEAAAGHAVRILGPFEEKLRSAAGDPDVVLVTGGDHDAIEAVLADQRLRLLATRVVEPFLAVPDPRRSVLEGAIADAGSVRMTVVNT